MVNIGRYSDFVKNSKALAKLQAWIDQGGSIEGQYGAGSRGSA